MSMLIIKNEKLSEALKKLRELYPDDSLGDAIIMAVDRVQKAEENIKKYRNEAIRAKEKAYDFDKRYCDLLVEKRQLEIKVKQLNALIDTRIEEAEVLEQENNDLKMALNAAYETHNEKMTFLDLNKLEEMEK